MTEPKKKKRKPKPPKVKNNKTSMIGLRVTPGEKAAIIARADELGIDISKLLIRSFLACKTGDPRRLRPLLPSWPVASDADCDETQLLLVSEKCFTPKPESQD
jgi:hypothetical protein